MSERDWVGSLQTLSLSLAFFTAIGFSLATYTIGYGLGKDHYSNEYSGNYHDNYAADRIERECVLADPPPIELHECIQKQIEASVEHQTAYADLKSQERMAFWAMLMGLFTGLNVLVTTVGVVFVARTLRATTDTVGQMRDTNKIMRSEQRPWVSMSWQVACEFCQVSETRCKVLWFYNFDNKGKMPAHNVRISWGIHRHSTRYIGAGRQGVPERIESATRTRNISTKILHPGERTEFLPPGGWTYQGVIEGEDVGDIFLVACIAYDLDPMGNESGYEVRVFRIKRDPEVMGPFAHEARNMVNYQEIG